MPIKKTLLESKWYYRIAKVIFLILPLLVGAFFVLKYRAAILGFTQKTFVAFTQTNSTKIVYVVVGIILYYLLIQGLWKIIIYLIWGGIKDDRERGPQPSQQQQATSAAVISILIIIGALFVFALSEKGYLNSGTTKVKKSLYGIICTSKGVPGIYGTNGACMTCSSGVPSTKDIGGCSKSGCYLQIREVDWSVGHVETNLNQLQIFVLKMIRLGPMKISIMILIVDSHPETI